jgi:Uncharacterized protein conserved in bacteria (DUF2171)
MADPVSWLVIERGWRVLDREGEHVGEVEETVGDSSVDVFDGLSVATSFLGRPRYVPSEQVGEITEGSVRLKLSREEVERLSEYKEPPTSAQIEPEKAGLVTRLEADVEAPIHSHPERENIWRRLWLRLSGRLRRT